MTKKTFRNWLEMKLLGYSVYGEREGWKTTARRFFRKLIDPIRVKFGIGYCSVCGKFERGLSYQMIDAEPEQDDEGWTMIPVKGYACAGCQALIEGGIGYV